MSKNNELGQGLEIVPIILFFVSAAFVIVTSFIDAVVPYSFLYKSIIMPKDSKAYSDFLVRIDVLIALTLLATLISFVIFWRATVKALKSPKDVRIDLASEPLFYGGFFFMMSLSLLAVEIYLRKSPHQTERFVEWSLWMLYGSIGLFSITMMIRLLRKVGTLSKKAR